MSGSISYVAVFLNSGHTGNPRPLLHKQGVLSACQGKSAGHDKGPISRDSHSDEEQANDRPSKGGNHRKEDAVGAWCGEAVGTE